MKRPRLPVDFSKFTSVLPEFRYHNERKIQCTQVSTIWIVEHYALTEWFGLPEWTECLLLNLSCPRNFALPCSTAASSQGGCSADSAGAKVTLDKSNPLGIQMEIQTFQMPRDQGMISLPIPMLTRHAHGIRCR